MHRNDLGMVIRNIGMFSRCGFIGQVWSAH